MTRGFRCCHPKGHSNQVTWYTTLRIRTGWKKYFLKICHYGITNTLTKSCVVFYLSNWWTDLLSRKFYWGFANFLVYKNNTCPLLCCLTRVSIFTTVRQGIVFSVSQALPIVPFKYQYQLSTSYIQIWKIYLDIS